VPLARPSFDAEEERALVEVLRSGWVTQGPRVEEFEARFAECVGAGYAVAVSSGTAALFLSLHALGIGPGDEVLVPSLSFVASANAIVHCGASPVFVDVEPRSWNLDPEAAAAALSPRTRAVLVVHQLGMPAALDAIEGVAARAGIEIVEDAACALGSRWRGRPIGSSGHLGCFSFHPRKVAVTGEGGMIVTADGALAARLRRLRHQGMSVSDLDRHRAGRAIVERYDEVGYNFRLSDLHAALGVVQLRKLDRLVAARRAIAERYAEALRGLEVEPFQEPAESRANYQSYLVRLRGVERAQRDRFLAAMQRRGVATRRGLMAAHLEPCHAGARISGRLVHTEAAEAQTVVLPIYAGLDRADQDYVIEQFFDAGREVLPGEGGRRAGGGIRR
jgi:dTDP-4-amino-4,6-dideoxygalactose transaminase